MYLYKISFVETHVSNLNYHFELITGSLFVKYECSFKKMPSYHDVWESDVKDTQLNFVMNLLNHRKGYLLFLLVTITH